MKKVFFVLLGIALFTLCLYLYEWGAGAPVCMLIAFAAGQISLLTWPEGGKR